VPASVTYSCATNAVFLSGAAASVLAHARAQKRQHHSRATYPLVVARAITFGWGGGHPPPRTSRACLFLPARAFSTTHARHRLFPTPQPLICSHTGAQPEAHSVVGSPSDLFTRTNFALSCPHRNQPRTQNQCSSYGAFVPAGHTIHTRTRLSHFASTVCTYRPIYLPFSFRLRSLLHNRLTCTFPMPSCVPTHVPTVDPTHIPNLRIMEISIGDPTQPTAIPASVPDFSLLGQPKQLHVAPFLSQPWFLPYSSPQSESNLSGPV